MKEWEARAYTAEDEVKNCKAKYAALEHKAKKDESAVISNYMNSEPFLQFMDSHDDALRPDFLTTGWEKAIHAVGSAHPGMFDPSEFPSPWMKAADHASGSGARAVSQVSGSSSKGGRQASGSGSKGADRAVSSGPPTKGTIRCALPDKGIRNELSSSSSSSEETDEDSSGEEESEEENAEGDAGDQEARTNEGVDGDSD